jgi:hypothetical protein
MDLNLLERNLTEIDQLVAKFSPNTLTLVIAMIQQINTGLEGETGGLNEISQLIFLIAKQPLPVQKLVARCIVNKIEREV